MMAGGGQTAEGLANGCGYQCPGKSGANDRVQRFHTRETAIRAAP